MNRDEALAFCELLYGDPRLADEGLQIVVASLPPGRGGKLGYTFCQTPEHAANTAIKIAEEGNNAYAGMALVDPATMKGKRGNANDARAIVGFWADIDIADPATPKPGKNPPCDIKEASLIAAGVGCPPSVVVHSGHGIHAYWLFREPWIFADEDERRYAADVARSWELTLHNVARNMGRTLDSVGDLARILRIPGTVNSKVAAIRTEVRFSYPEALESVPLAKKRSRRILETLIRAPAQGQTGDVIKPEKLHGVSYRFPDAKERAAMLNRIAMTSLSSAMFRDTWDRQRADFASNQHSASEYDMSIAHQCVAAGWSDQEVYWAMLMWREEHREETDKLLKRTDYAELTIAKAKKGNIKAVAIRAVDEIAQTVQHMDIQPLPQTPEQQAEVNEKRDALRERTFSEISNLLGVRVTQFTREGDGNGCNYYMTINGHEVQIGSGTDLNNQRVARVRIFDNANMAPPLMKEQQWSDAMNLLCQFVIIRANPYVSNTYKVFMHLMNYTEAATLHGEDGRNPDEAIKSAMAAQRPHWVNGNEERQLVFSYEMFTTYIKRFTADRFSNAQLADALGKIGAKNEPRYFCIDGKQRHRRVWMVTEGNIEKHRRVLDSQVKDQPGNESTPA